MKSNPVLRAKPLAWLLLPLVPPLASAAPIASLLSPVVVTATRTEQPLDQTLASTQVIGRDEIERAGTLTLAEVLQRFAGLEIRSTGGAGQPAGIFLRGANAQHTLVLVDGLRVGSATSGATAIEHLPIDNIERIEIVKGALSGLYGSDAIGGVVQIFTRRDAKPRLDAAVGVGTQSSTLMSLGLASTERNTALVFDAGWRDTRDGSATNPRVAYGYNPDRDPYHQRYASFLLSHTLWQGEVVSLRAWQSRGQADFDDGPGTARNTQTLSGLQVVSENTISPGWTSRLMVGTASDESTIEGSFGGRFKTTQTQASWLNQFRTDLGFLQAGAEYRKERVEASTAYDVGARETASVFAGYLERLGPGQFEFTLRRDEVDGKKRDNSGTVSYGYAVTPALTAYLRAGRSHRTPSFNDLYYPGFSNPALKSEKADQAETGLRFSKDGVRAALVRFENRIDNLIVFDPAAGKPVNLARSRITGWEFNASATWWGIDARAAFTAQQPVDRDTGRQLRGRARSFGSLDLSTRRGDWTYGANLYASAHRFDSGNEEAATRMGGYALVGASAAYRLDKRWRIELNAQNLTGRHYELAQGYETPRRSVFLSARVAF